MRRGSGPAGQPSALDRPPLPFLVSVAAQRDSESLIAPPDERPSLIRIGRLPRLPLRESLGGCCAPSGWAELARERGPDADDSIDDGRSDRKLTHRHSRGLGSDPRLRASITVFLSSASSPSARQPRRVRPRPPALGPARLEPGRQWTPSYRGSPLTGYCGSTSADKDVSHCSCCSAASSRPSSCRSAHGPACSLPLPDLPHLSPS